MKIYIPLFLFLLMLSPLAGQDGWLIGLLDNKLVEIDQQDASLRYLTDITVPTNVRISTITYSSSNCLFYGTIRPDTNPTLVTVDWDGNYTEIGPITVAGETVFLSEGLAFNEVDGKLYASVSLNGGRPTGDNFTETIVEINPLNGSATIVSELAPNSTLQTDIDYMTFIGNTLFIRDGHPIGTGTTEFYELDFTGLGAIATPTLLLSTPFAGSWDLTAIGNQIFLASTDLGFYVLDTDIPNINYIGQTHVSPDFNGEVITGITFAENAAMDLLNVDATLCQGETLSLTVALNDADVLWNTGSTSNAITVNTAGMYWAEIRLGNCLFTSDTALVAYQSCDTCQVIEAEISDLLMIGPDTSICTGETIDLQLNFAPPFEITWNNGDIGPSITVEQAGIYSASVLLDTCVFMTPPLNLSTNICGNCSYYIPNAFSPQGDGMNDTFKVYFGEGSCEVVTLAMSVLDRWGNLLFESDGAAWDGYAKGKPVEVGVYVYLIRMTVNQDGVLTEIVESGDVSVLR